MVLSGTNKQNIEQASTQQTTERLTYATEQKKVVRELTEK
jgi:hypothetical protein